MILTEKAKGFGDGDIIWLPICLVDGRKRIRLIGAMR